MEGLPNWKDALLALRTWLKAVPNFSHPSGVREGSQVPEGVLRSQAPAQSGDRTSVLEVFRVASDQVHLQPEVQVGIITTVNHTQGVSLTFLSCREWVFLLSPLKSCHRRGKSPHRDVPFSRSHHFIALHRMWAKSFHHPCVLYSVSCLCYYYVCFYKVFLCCFYKVLLFLITKSFMALVKNSSIQDML